jgi:hypothetical protein
MSRFDSFPTIHNRKTSTSHFNPWNCFEKDVWLGRSSAMEECLKSQLELMKFYWKCSWLCDVLNVECLMSWWLSMTALMCWQDMLRCWCVDVSRGWMKFSLLQKVNPRFGSHRITPHRITPHRAHRIASHRSTAHHTTSHHIITRCITVITAHHSTTHRSTSQHITSHHSTAQHITSQHIPSHPNTVHHSHHSTSQHNNLIAAHHITSHRITAQHITSHRITSQRITSPRITSHHIASHHIASHHIASIAAHHIASRHITSQHSTPHHTTSQHSTSHSHLEVFSTGQPTSCHFMFVWEKNLLQKRLWSAFFHCFQSLVLVRQLCTPLFYAPWQHFDGPRKPRPLTGRLSSCPPCLVCAQCIVWLSRSQP